MAKKTKEDISDERLYRLLRYAYLIRGGMSYVISYHAARCHDLRKVRRFLAGSNDIQSIADAQRHHWIDHVETGKTETA